MQRRQTTRHRQQEAVLSLAPDARPRRPQKMTPRCLVARTRRAGRPTAQFQASRQTRLAQCLSTARTVTRVFTSRDITTMLTPGPTEPLTASTLTPMPRLQLYTTTNMSCTSPLAAQQVTGHP